MSTTPPPDKCCNGQQPQSGAIQQEQNNIERTAEENRGRQKRKRGGESLPDDTELFEERKSGKRIKDLAKKYHVSRQTITRRLKEFSGQEYREIAKRKIDESAARRGKRQRDLCGGSKLTRKR